MGIRTVAQPAGELVVMHSGITLRPAWHRTVPDIRQVETAECGLACLAMIAVYHGQQTDLAMLRHMVYLDLPLADYRKIIAVNVAALNHAVRDLPAERMRMHVCWGSTMAPRHTDVELKDIVDIILTAKPQAVSFPAANGRHEHEWKIWRDVKLPDGKIIIPGVIDSTVNTVEHPEVVADRILNFAGAVGRENVIAGVDCGFGTFAGRVQVDTKIVWMKLASLAEGARRASKQLWTKAA